MSIYLITRGEYSDYGVVGYCTSKRTAEKVCAQLNRKEAQSKYSDPYMVERCRCMDEKPQAKHTAYEYRFYATKFIDGTVRMNNPLATMGDGMLVDGWLPTKVKYEDVNWIANGISTCIKGSYSIYVRTDKKDPDKALKIAEDALAKYRAEEEGL